MAKRNRQRERQQNTNNLANKYARAFNRVVEQAGVDLPIELIGKLVELFGDAMATGAALERDYGALELEAMAKIINKNGPVASSDATPNSEPPQP